MPVLVLIDEMRQFSKLLPYLTHGPIGFAHGPLNDDNKPDVPPEYWDSDPKQLVSDFNSGKIPILIGTSCISTGTDIKAVRILIFLQGGKSEIAVKQAIGRGTRLYPGKPQCNIVDYMPMTPDGEFTYQGIRNSQFPKWTPGWHALERIKIYNEIYAPVQELDIT
jgi:hypothetical protein